MMRVAAGAGKTVGAVMVAVLAWINTTLTPLFWVLLALIAVDLLLNLRQEGKQLQKLGSAFFSLGLPVFVEQYAANWQNPEFLKGVVALITIGYIWVVVPQLFAWVQRIVPKAKRPVVQAIEPEVMQQILAAVKAEVAKTAPQEAAQIDASIAQAQTPGTEQQKGA